MLNPPKHNFPTTHQNRQLTLSMNLKHIFSAASMANNRHKRNRTKINNQKMKFENLEMQIPDTPPLSSDEKQNTAMNYIRIS